MNTVYRTYEVLIEETLSSSDPKRLNSSKPSRENAATRRALETTHRIFQDAVCYYILCLIGMVRDAKETALDGFETETNPLWRTLMSGEQGNKTDKLVRRFRERYPVAPWGNISNLSEFYAAVFDWKRLLPRIGPSELEQTYRLLFSQATGDTGEKSGEEVAAALELENLKSFAGTWIAILCNEDGDTTIPGGGVYDVLHRQLRSCQNDDPRTLDHLVKVAVERALMQRTADLQNWQTARLERSKRKNQISKKKKPTDLIAIEVEKSVAEKTRKECATLRAAYLELQAIETGSHHFARWLLNGSVLPATPGD